MGWPLRLNGQEFQQTQQTGRTGKRERAAVREVAQWGHQLRDWTTEALSGENDFMTLLNENIRDNVGAFGPCLPGPSRVSANNCTGKHKTGTCSAACETAMSAARNFYHVPSRCYWRAALT